jgi:hypothetical protein
MEVRVKGSCTGAEVAFSVDGGAKGFFVGAEVGSLIGAKGSPGGSFVGADRASSVGAGSGGLSLAPVGTVGISFGTPLMAIFLWSIRAVGSLVGAEVSVLIWASSITAEGFLVGTGGFSGKGGIDQCCAGSFPGEVAGSSGIRGGSLGKAIWSSLGKAIWSSLGKAIWSSPGKNSVSIVEEDRDGSSSDKDGSSFDGGFGGILVLCSF